MADEDEAAPDAEVAPKGGKGKLIIMIVGGCCWSVVAVSACRWS